MSKKYAVYKLTKVKGTKLFEVSTTYVCKSLKDAFRELDIWDEELDEPVCFNRKTDEVEAYTLSDRVLYVPNYAPKEAGDEGEVVLIGVYSRFPIYYIDEYPNPYRYYKIHVKNSSFFSSIQLEGIE